MIVRAEAMQLAGVHAAVIAGLGVALMAALEQTPEGLAARDELPRADPIPLARWSRHHHGASETAIYVVSGNPVFVFLDVDGDEPAERRIQATPS